MGLRLMQEEVTELFERAETFRRNHPGEDSPSFLNAPLQTLSDRGLRVEDECKFRDRDDAVEVLELLDLGKQMIGSAEAAVDVLNDLVSLLRCLYLLPSTITNTAIFSRCSKKASLRQS